MKDFAGNEIIRPKCPHCRAEMKWQGDPCSNEDGIGYYCFTHRCKHYGQSERQIAAGDPVWRNLDPDSDNFAPPSI